jgi:glycosyltransferase involved in cell wall biosynthesis
LGHDQIGGLSDGYAVVERRILYVHGIEAIGGAEQDLLLLLRGLDRTQWTPMVACPEQGAFRACVETLGIPVSPIKLPPWRKLPSLFSRYAAVKDFSTLLGSLQPALIHINDIWWVPHTICAVKRLTGGVIPVIVHVRQNIKAEKVRAYLLDQADYILAVSHQVRAVLEQGGVSSPRVSTLYSGVDLAACSEAGDGKSIRARHGIPADALLIGTVANLLPIKGYEVLIKALPAIFAKVPTAHYLIVGAGSGEYPEHLQKLCADQGLADRVHFVGFQNQTWPYLAALDLYVQPSLNEAFGIAAAEAMAMGKAVVASRVGGLPEVVADQQTGLLVSPGNAVELSKAILSLLEDRPRREHLGRCGVARVQEHFNLKTALAGIEQVYAKVLAKEQAR